MGLLSRLFGPKEPPRPPRDILAEAIADIGDASMPSQALALFDAPQALIEEWEKVQGELPAWADPQRPETEAELAWQVFEHVLEQHGRIGFLDWSAGWGDIETEFNRLFARAGVDAVSEQERARMSEAMEIASALRPGKRPLAVEVLWDFMDEMVGRRELKLDWLTTDADCHHPIVMRPEAYEKWKPARFGKGVDVLP
jgi:hypothetical protein